MSRLPAADRAIVTRLLRPDLGPLFQGEPPQVVDRALRSFRAERLRLGGISGIVVQPTGNELCGATGNCAFWLIDLPHRRILLSAEMVQTYAVDSASSSRVPDFITGMHDSATQSALTRWHYDGMHFRATDCAIVDYADSDGNRYSQPKFTPHPCNSEGNDRTQ